MEYDIVESQMRQREKKKKIDRERDRERERSRNFCLNCVSCSPFHHLVSDSQRLPRISDARVQTISAFSIKVWQNSKSDCTIE